MGGEINQLTHERYYYRNQQPYELLMDMLQC